MGIHIPVAHALVTRRASADALCATGIYITHSAYAGALWVTYYQLRGSRSAGTCAMGSKKGALWVAVFLVVGAHSSLLRL
jgi:hypothetical protein